MVLQQLTQLCATWFDSSVWQCNPARCTSDISSCSRLTGTTRPSTLFFGLLKQYVGGHLFHSSGKRKYLWMGVNARAQVLQQQNFSTCAKIGQMLWCSWDLCWKVTIFQWNKWGTFNVVVTSCLIFPGPRNLTVNLHWRLKEKSAGFTTEHVFWQKSYLSISHTLLFTHHFHISWFQTFALFWMLYVNNTKFLYLLWHHVVWLTNGSVLVEDFNNALTILLGVIMWALIPSESICSALLFWWLVYAVFTQI